MNKNILRASGLALASGILLAGCGDSPETKQAKDGIIEPVAVHIAKVAIRNIDNKNEHRQFIASREGKKITLIHHESQEFHDAKKTERTETIEVTIDAPTEPGKYDPTTVSEVAVRDDTCYEKKSGDFECTDGSEGNLYGPTAELQGKDDDQWGVK
jgi:hypothetical protein